MNRHNSVSPQQEDTFYHSLVANASAAMQVLDKKGRIRYDNPAFALLTGYTNEETNGKRAIAFVHPEDRRLVFTCITEFIASGEKTSAPVEFRVQHRNGNWTWVESTAVNLIDDPQVQGIFMNHHDINLGKKRSTELRKINESLHKRASVLAESNSELERFALVSSHDLQEPLRMVTGFLHLLKKRYGDQLDSTAQQYISFAVDGSDRMKKMINDLLGYSRIGTNQEETSSIDLNILLAEVTELFRETISKNGAQIESGHLPVVYGKKTQLQQVFQNLLSNALKYRSVRPLQVRINCTEEAQQWKIEFSDNGIGIDPKFKEKIFVIFQRLHSKSHYSGNGIGLAVSKKIIEQHGGNIWVESEPGNGSSFYFTIAR